MMIRYILFLLSCYLLFAASAHPIKGEVGATDNEPQRVPVAIKGKKSRDMPNCEERKFDPLSGCSLGGRRKRAIPGKKSHSDPQISARKKRQQRHDSMRKRRSINSVDRPRESFAFREGFTILPSF